MKDKYSFEIFFTIFFILIATILFVYFFEYINFNYDIPLFLTYTLSCLFFSIINAFLLLINYNMILKIPLDIEKAVNIYDKIFYIVFSLTYIIPVAIFFYMFGFRNLIINFMVPLISFSPFFFISIFPLSFEKEEKSKTSFDANFKRKNIFSWMNKFSLLNKEYHKLFLDITENLDEHFYNNKTVDNFDKKVSFFCYLEKNLEFIHKTTMPLVNEYDEQTNTYEVLKQYEDAVREVEELRMLYISSQSRGLSEVYDENSRKYKSYMKQYEEEAHSKFPMPTKPSV